MDRSKRERYERAAALNTATNAILGMGGPFVGGGVAAYDAPEGKKLRAGAGAFGGSLGGAVLGGVGGGVAGGVSLSALAKILGAGSLKTARYGKGGAALGTLLGGLYGSHQGTKKGMELLNG